ncbi:hypothetical protein T492DRAFT_964202 [Pavlovales sp. CCMP2436]|nr:hypothetical protein T492DRAFT_964202 [Pavlovales sp. CCMP2436]
MTRGPQLSIIVLCSLKWRGAGAKWPRASMTTRRRALIAEEIRTSGARRAVTIRSDVSSIATRWQLSPHGHQGVLR